VTGINPLDPRTWIPGTNRLFRPLWNAGSAESAGGGGGNGEGFGGGEDEEPLVGYLAPDALPKPCTINTQLPKPFIIYLKPIDLRP
jgi:hypothetical protein